MKSTPLITLFFLLTYSVFSQDCGCDHVIEPKSNGQAFCTNENMECEINWGTNIHVKPGETICMMAGVYPQYMAFYNLTGTPDNPIVIKNCGGQVIIEPTSQGFDIWNSTDFIITGTGDPNFKYGFLIDGGENRAGMDGIRANHFTNSYQVDHVEVKNVSNHGFDMKNDPFCSDPRAWRSSKIDNDHIIVHDTYVHSIGREGFYVGDSHYHETLGCGFPNDNYPSEQIQEQSILRCEIYNNIVEDTGNDGIQVGSVIGEARIHDNIVRKYGVTDVTGQHRSGIQTNPGTKGVIYNNLVTDGQGAAFFITGDGANIFNNVVVNAKTGVEHYSRMTSDGSKYLVHNNTFVNITESGIAMLPVNFTIAANVFNNNIVHAQSAAKFWGYAENKAFEKIDSESNIFTYDLESIGFVSPEKGDFRIKSNSDAKDKGKALSSADYNIPDVSGYNRVVGTSIDIGAHEYVAPTLGISTATIDFGKSKTVDASQIQEYKITMNGMNMRTILEIPQLRHFNLALSPLDFTEDPAEFDDKSSLMINFDSLQSVEATIYIQIDPQTEGILQRDTIHHVNDEDSSAPKLIITSEMGVLSVDEIIQADDISIYPNPQKSGEKIDISLNETPFETTKVALLDIGGKVISTMESDNQKFSLKIPNKLPPGVYLIKLNVNGKELRTKKIRIENQ